MLKALDSFGSSLNIFLPLCILLCFIKTASSTHADQAKTSSLLSPIGDPIDVWDSVDTWKRCKIVDVPDIPARIYVEGEDKIHMIEGSTHFYPMLGNSIFNFTRSCKPAWNMTGDGDPAMFSANEFLDSAIAFSNGTVVALIHTEFPGNRYNMCNSTAYPLCWTVSIGLAISSDHGLSWSHARPPPNHLMAAVPYVYDETQLAYGWGDPSNIVLNPKDGYYYVAMWNRNQIGKQKSGICIARTRELLDPSSWKGWDGRGFSTTFVSPYSMDPKAPKDQHICTVIENIPTLCAALSMVWSVYLEKFVMTIGCFDELSKSFYISTSDDLIHWTPMRPFFDADMVPPRVKKMITSISYPSLLDPLAFSSRGDRNFYTIGKEPYLFWVSLGHSPYTDGRHLWASPMRFNREEEDLSNA